MAAEPTLLLQYVRLLSGSKRYLPWLLVLIVLVSRYALHRPVGHHRFYDATSDDGGKLASAS